MKQDVWMPVVIGDYLGDTQRLTTEQHGAYFLLLMDYWRSGPPPADDDVLCSITRLKPARFRKHKSTLLSFFRVVDGKLVNKRADEEKSRAEQNARRNSEKARLAANARWGVGNGDAPSNAPSIPPSNAPECPSPSPTFPKGKAGEDKGLVFDQGLALLTNAGASIASARAYLGKLCKEHSAAKVAVAVTAALDLDPPPIEPKSWLQGALRKQANDGAGLLDSINRKYESKEAA